MKIWLLKSDNEYRSLQLTNFKEDHEKNFKNGFLTDPDLALRWVAPRVYDYESDGISGDFPHFWAGSGIPVFSERAINILKEVIACSGDILPLYHPDKQYNVFRVTNTLDAIDYEKSEIEKLITGLTVGFQKYAFIPEKLNNQYIFKVFLNERIYSTATFVTDAFKDIVTKADLKGFNFKQVWEL
ncbi:hypothetical protein QFZ81_002995 [Paenibacillus sp. V4I9]|uniref:imm11 family protein n=1 Tax=Paenibacillus sp. V4I9 TaxID=3042308 RepID=UPI0027889C7B|nr:DUF1629 domain-containing protein [Paenibacillus sp. V4I9]MDQ0887907.1 hypothetical protein [Paenibacillus sp. V4I9]